MIYNKLVEEYFFSPLHVGELEIDGSNTVHYRLNDAHRGALIDLYLRYTDTRYIEKICFKAKGNPFLIAAIEWMCRALEGQQVDTVTLATYKDLIKHCDIPDNQYPIAIQVDMAFKELFVLMRNKS